MAKEKRVMVNKPMLEALKKMILRNIETCPLCGLDLDEHSWFQFTEKGQLTNCSNWENA